MKKRKEERTILIIRNRKIPVRIIREPRRSMRAAIGKNAVLLRLPSGIWQENLGQELGKVRTWLEQLADERDGVLERLAVKTYESGQTIKVGHRNYELRIAYENRQTHSAKLSNSLIQLRLANGEDEVNLQKKIRQLLSRVIAKDFLPAIIRRVDDLNDRHFQQNIKDVRLKYNHSNWGSCSNSGNINLSTRLLFAPDEVIDYVIVHELAHLVELNHSKRFWKIVEKVAPDYQKAERWLKENSYLCDF